MNESKIKELLDQASETHSVVYKNQQGVDADWPLWYAAWLMGHTDLPEVIEDGMTESELVHFFVEVEDEYRQQKSDQDGWQGYYAERLVEILSAGDEEAR